MVLTTKRQYEHWQWRVPFSAERFVVPYDTKAKEIIKRLDAQFTELMNYEKDLLQVMNNE